MRGAHRHLLPLAVASLALIQCTNASVFADNGEGAEGPDRAIINGTICAPSPSGPTFPVKVLFMFEGGPEVNADSSVLQTAADTVATEVPGEAMSLALEAFHTTGNGLLPTFSDPTTFQAAMLTFSGFQENGPVSIAEGLEVAQNILSDDFQTSCAGTLARTRYVVVVAFTTADQTCTNPAYANVTDPSACSTDGGLSGQPCADCRLTYDTLAIRTLATKAGVGELDIVPIYYYSGMQDPDAQDDAQTIAMAAGTTSLTIPDTALLNDLEELPGFGYHSIEAPLVLRQLFAWNQNALARNGQLLVDSDADGLSDEDEVNLYHSDPLLYDTNGDGIGDGVAVAKGYPPDASIVLMGCNPTLDSDGDRLNDCEEQLLGTDPCQFDTDADTFSDLVEVVGHTNPLVAEGNQDTDHDGFPNAIELAEHTDPNSVDIAFREDHAYFPVVLDGGETADGRNCYDFEISNIGLVSTQQLPNPPFAPIDAGTNNIFIYAVMGFAGRLTGEVNMVDVVQIQYSPTAPYQTPPSPILVTPDEFITGQ